MPSADAPVGTRAVCATCGRTIWLRLSGIDGWTGKESYRWFARRGTKPNESCGRGHHTPRVIPPGTGDADA